ncbi:MAG TPA: hypothetical protein VGB30_00710 [bacterium]
MKFPITYFSLILLAALIFIPASSVRAEIMNDTEYGSLEIIDISVIENAADRFTPVGLSFNVTRGGTVYHGDQVIIKYRGIHERWVTILDYTPDRIVKPLVFNEKTSLLDGLDREYTAEVGGATGDEYILMIVSTLPITDSQLETYALAPDEIEPGENILLVAVNNFRVAPRWNTGDSVVEWGNSLRSDYSDIGWIPLEEFATYINYPLNQPRYNPWRYMYLYPYPRIRPTTYINNFGPLTNTWYVIPQGNTIQSNFWNYSNTGWIDNGIWVIPPGGSWEGKFRLNDPYADYYLRVLPFIARNSSMANYRVEINGTLVQPSIDITGAIGWGEYWTTNPFNYYSMQNFLRAGENDIRIYVPEDASDDLYIQLADVVPTETVQDELDAVETE